MEKKIRKRRIVLGAAIALLVAYLFAGDQVKAVYHTIRGVISPFILGAIFAFILNVPMRAIERRLGFIKKQNFKRFIAIIITVKTWARSGDLKEDKHSFRNKYLLGTLASLVLSMIAFLVFKV